MRSGTPIALGVFAAVQTFLLVAQRDRFAVLFWWTTESWLLVTLLWLKDLALAGLAFVAFRHLDIATASLPEPVEAGDRASRIRHALLFAGVLAAGVALRFVSPRQIPPGVWYDALTEAEGALRDPGGIPWLGGRPFAPEAGGTALISHLYVRFCELLFRFFGRGDSGILALSAIPGSLTLPALYWFGREMGGRQVALVAMTLCAFAMSPLVFSRWAYTAALLLPLVLAAAAATLRAVATRSIGWALLAGSLLGLSLHTYVPAWAIAASIGIFALTSLARPRWKLVVTAGIAGLVTFLPFAVAYLQFPQRLGGRARDVSFLAPTVSASLPGGSGPVPVTLRLLHNVVEYTGALLWRGDPTPRNGMPGRPVFTVLIGVAVLAGVALSWRRARAGDLRHRLLLLLAGASLLAGILSIPADAPNVLRIYPLVGLSFLFAAESLVRWIPACARALSARVGFLWALAFSLLLVLETRRFLTVWPENPLVVAAFCNADTRAGRTAGALGPAPIIVEPGVLSCPIVFETLAAGSDPSRPVRRIPRRSAAELLAKPEDRAFWYVTRRTELDRLRSRGWRAARGVEPGGDSRATVIARVVPPAPAN